MTDLNDVKAGKYQLVAVRWDQITSKPGEPLDYTRYRRGDIVNLNAEDAKRLAAAGAVVKPGELEKAQAEKAKAEAEQAAAAYQATLAGLPEDVRKEATPEVPAPDESKSEAPAKSASKAEWVEYAVAQGMSEEDANAATKDDLAAKYSG